MSDSGELFVVVQATPNTDYSATNSYRYVGGVWRQPVTFDNPAPDLYSGPQALTYVSTANGTELIAVQIDGASTFASTDDGASWTKKGSMQFVPGGGVRAIGNYLFGIGSSGNLSRWNIGTGQNEPISTPSPTPSSPYLFSDPGSPTTIWIAQTGSYQIYPLAGWSEAGQVTLFKSTDSGSTWTHPADQTGTRFVDSDPVPADFPLQTATWVQPMTFQVGSDGRLHIFTYTTGSGGTTAYEVSRSLTQAPDWSGVTRLVVDAAGTGATITTTQRSDGTAPGPMSAWAAIPTGSGGAEDIYWLQTGTALTTPTSSPFVASGAQIATATSVVNYPVSSPKRKWQAIGIAQNGVDYVLRSNDGTHWDQIPLPAGVAGKLIVGLAISDLGEAYFDTYTGTYPNYSPTSMFKWIGNRWYGPIISANSRSATTGPLYLTNFTNTLWSIEAGSDRIFYSTDDGRSWAPSDQYYSTGTNNGNYPVSGDLTSNFFHSITSAIPSYLRWDLTTKAFATVTRPPPGPLPYTAQVMVEHDNGQVWIAALATNNTVVLDNSTDEGDHWDPVDLGTPLPIGFSWDSTGLALGGDDRLYAFRTSVAGGNVSVLEASRALGATPNWTPTVTVATEPGASGSLSVVKSMSASAPTPPDVWLTTQPSGGGSSTVYHFGTMGATPIGGPLTPAERGPGFNPGEPCTVCHVGKVGDPVVTPDGSFAHAFTDLALPGRGPSLGFTHSYDTVDASRTGPLGYGWSDPYMSNVAISGTAPNRVATVTQENGAQVSFTESGGSWIPAAPRVIAALTYDAGTNEYTFTRAGGRQIFTFDGATGRLISMSDSDGNVLSLAYDASGNLQTVTDGANRSLSFVYYSSGNGIGKIESVSDGLGRTVSFVYDASGNLASATEPDGGQWTFAYDLAHRVLTLLDPNQQSLPQAQQHPLTNHYNAQGQIDIQTDQLGRQTLVSYNIDSTYTGTVTTTDPTGNVTQETYWNSLRLSVTSGYGTPQAATTNFAYDMGLLLPTAVQDPNGGITLYGYDSRGNQTSTKDPLGRLTTATYNGFNEPVTITDAIGNAAGGTPTDHTTTYAYDAAGRLISESRQCVLPTGASCGTQATTLQHGDPVHPGDVTSIADPNLKPWLYTYDAAGDRTSVTDPLMNKTVSCFDTVGRMSASIAPAGVAAGVTCSTTTPAPYTSYFTYDAANGLLTSKDPLGHQRIYSYDSDLNLQTEQDPNTNLTRYGYDLANELTTITRADTTVQRNHYWPDGRLKDQYDANNQPTSYAYDPLGRVSSVTDPLNRTTSYTYDSNGNKLTEQSPGGDCGASPAVGCTTYGYDAANESTSVSYSDSATPDVSNISYDNDGQRIGMTDGTGTPSSWSYDSLHRITSTTNGAGATTGFGYDLNGNQTSITYPGSHTVNYTYYDNGAMHTATDWWSRTTSFAYDADNNLTTETLPSSPNLVDTFGYNAADQMSSISDVAGSTTEFSATYGRDANGQLNSDTSVPSATGHDGYDPLNQLCAAYSSTGNTCSPSTTGAASYGYDAADNLTNNNATTQAYDAAGQLCWTVAGTSTAPCGGTTPSGATTYGSNVLGERTNVTPATGVPATTFGYDQARRLTSVTSNGYQTDVLGSSPVAYWRLGEASGTTAIDSSTHGHTGTYTNFLSGLASTAGAPPTDNDTAQTFSGSDYVAIASPGTQAGQTSAFSIEAWIKTTATANQYVVSEGNTSTTTSYDGLHVSAGKALFTVTGASANVAVTGSTTVNDGLWHHLVGVRTGTGTSTTLSIYVDGKLDGTTSGVSPGTVTLNTTTIGALHRTTVSNDFVGSVDDAAFYSTAVTAAKVNKDYLAAASNYGGALGANNSGNSCYQYWQFDVLGNFAPDSGTCGTPGSYASGITLGVPGALKGNNDMATTFNGTTGYMGAASENMGGRTAFSAEAWVKTTGTGSWILAEGSSTSNAGYDGLHINASGVPVFTLSGPSGTVNATGTTPVNDGQWHQLVGVRTATSGTTLTLYVDNQVAATATGTTGTLGAGTDTDTIGAIGRLSTQYYLAGTIDDAAYFPVALTAAQINSQYRNATTQQYNAATYAYNGDNLRTTKTLNGTATNYTWSTNTNPSLLQETTGSTTNNYIYGPGGLPVEEITGASTARFFSHDQLGSTRLLTYSWGTTAASYTYDAYGNPTATGSIGVTTPLQFAAQYTDTETGFAYLRNRYYDPTTTQFLTPDPLTAITRSPYGYTHNNPLDATDPSGNYSTSGTPAQSAPGDASGSDNSENHFPGLDVVSAIGRAADPIHEVCENHCGAVGAGARIFSNIGKTTDVVSSGLEMLNTLRTSGGNTCSGLEILKFATVLLGGGDSLPGVGDHTGNAIDQSTALCASLNNWRIQEEQQIEIAENGPGPVRVWCPTGWVTVGP